ncbi:MAG: Re/Si-specific NAD(P)(+) transhydrogenase subunit alpha [Candidatus Dormibacteraeota bacterium]|nr:Re/Si-specific NAD(P)(+) transhydrogenase subunit alpha [Candidatus Dormibacteraeota bacterium]MBO0744099.1 Re/Si-specific NAD(P)(+) transhydrogenase subunit alpha [Candidatus Dormibacteraeota bacterium]
MKVFAPRETVPGERRVAITPDSAGRLRKSGVDVVVEHGAGMAASHDDAAYEAAGAAVAANAEEGYRGAGLVVKVQPPQLEEARALDSASALISFLQPGQQRALVDVFRERRITAFSLDLVPRISRAQSMDALSSQASLAGYKAVLLAADRLGKYFPMLMSAAGTIAPAKVLVLGAGVAGLQAIATARRLGAVVEAYDVRPAAREEVRSLGATFLELNLESQEGEGGYAREQSEEFLRRQRELLGERVASVDVVVTTAAVPGRRSPILVTAEMAQRMSRGSVLVDLAAEGGGNCELTRPGEVVETDGGAFIDGTTNLPSLVAVDASQLYARNVATLVQHLVADGSLHLDFEDEITAGCCVTHDGGLVSERAKQLLEVVAR